jgi:hypothetical protein
VSALLCEKLFELSGSGVKWVLTDTDSTLSDHGAVDLVDDAVDLGHVIGVRDDLIAGNNVLFTKKKGSVSSFFPYHIHR